MKPFPAKQHLRRFALNHKKKLITIALLSILYLFCLPNPLFKDPSSTVLLDRSGRLLGARIAADGQWRFPPTDSVPHKFARAIITFEDKRFYYHPGVDPLAILRAFRLNISQGEIVSGGSTLSMQVIRMSRKGKGRTFLEKIIEMIQATRAELRYSKDEILALYASHAPFGGNVVGLDAAAWKYYGRSAHQISWSEAATLAVLPNAPSLIHPGRNRDLLREKRDKLLDRLWEVGEIDSLTAQLGKLEPLPEKPLPLPNYAPHLLDRVQAQHKGTHAVIHSTIDHQLQAQAHEIVHRHHLHLKQNGIFNAAAMILDVKTGAVRAYIGNTDAGKEHGSAVDVIPARRSTGSILKPLLYAAMLDDGAILPNTLVPDIPTRYGGYNPKNYFRDYDGAVPAHQALARSLNVPAVRMLNQYGTARFHSFLTEVGMTTLNRPPNDYGLTLVLGGAEATLWDLSGIYASMARNLIDYHQFNGQYPAHNFLPPVFEQKQVKKRDELRAASPLKAHSAISAAATFMTFEALLEVNRPEVDRHWQRFASAQKIAWKTGTSYGFRDAWAIGCNPSHLVAVWVGNADGEGRPGLTGLQAAAPVMFDLFDAVGRGQGWFEVPHADFVPIPTCHHSGHLASSLCTDVDTIWGAVNGLQSPPCPYHQLVHLDESGTWRVHADCESPQDMQHKAYFILPPTQEAYYKSRHPSYTSLPPYRADCLDAITDNQMELIYPKFSSRIYVPVDLDGEVSKTVFEVTHRDPEAIIYWHLDDIYLGQTTHIHEMALNPSAGHHTLSLVDDKGKKLQRAFEVLAKK